MATKKNFRLRHLERLFYKIGLPVVVGGPTVTVVGGPSVTVVWGPTVTVVPQMITQSNMNLN